MTPRPVPLERYLSEPNLVESQLRKLLLGRRKVVILDIGACEGEDSIRYARHFPRGQVYSFEALPANQQIIQTNFARYRVRNAELVPLALSNRSGTATFHVSGGTPKQTQMGSEWNYGNKSSSLLPPASDRPIEGWITFNETIEVPCETLDTFCARANIETVDFIHMDVQGAESLVLEGAAQTLPRTLSLWLEIATEQLYRGQKLRSEMQEYLTARGFAMAFEHSHGVEGDQFYVNVRMPRGLLYWRALSLRRKFRRAASALV